MRTTLYRLRKFRACESRYNHLVVGLGKDWKDNKPIDILTILELNGVDDCLWALRTIIREKGGESKIRLMATDFAEEVLGVFEKKYPKDSRPREAIKAARDFSKGIISKEELSAAWSAARNAAWSAARNAAESAAREKQAAIIRKYLTEL